MQATLEKEVCSSQLSMLDVRFPGRTSQETFGLEYSKSDHQTRLLQSLMDEISDLHWGPLVLENYYIKDLHPHIAPIYPYVTWMTSCPETAPIHLYTIPPYPYGISPVPGITGTHIYIHMYIQIYIYMYIYLLFLFRVQKLCARGCPQNRCWRCAAGKARGGRPSDSLKRAQEPAGYRSYRLKSVDGVI